MNYDEMLIKDSEFKKNIAIEEGKLKAANKKVNIFMELGNKVTVNELTMNLDSAEVDTIKEMMVSKANKIEDEYNSMVKSYEDFKSNITFNKNKKSK